MSDEAALLATVLVAPSGPNPSLQQTAGHDSFLRPEAHAAPPLLSDMFGHRRQGAVSFKSRPDYDTSDAADWLDRWPRGAGGAAPGGC